MLFLIVDKVMVWGHGGCHSMGNEEVVAECEVEVRSIEWKR